MGHPRGSFALFFSFVCLLILGCGGTSNSPSGGGTGSTTPPPQNNPVPILTSINPASATAGSSGISITLTGTNFISSSVALWNGSSLFTSYTNSTTLTAQVSGADLQSPGTAKVTVSNPSPGGGTSGPVTFTIDPQPAQGAQILNILANDLAWDSVNQKIYLALPSKDGANGNSIQILDPTTATLGTSVFVGSEPNLLSVSANSKYLYVGLGGASKVQRVTLPSLAADISIDLGADKFDGPFYAMDLQAAPNSDTAVAVVRGTPGFSPEEEGGVVVYDDATGRPNVLCGWIQNGCTSPTGPGLFDSIQWNATGDEMYAANYEDTGFDFYTIPVDASGFGKVTDYGGLVPGFFGHIHFDKTTGYVYDDDGTIIDPSAGTVVGTFNASGSMVPDGTLNRAFFLGQTQSDVGSGTYTLESFDMQHFTPIGTMTFKNVAGQPTHLIRWGTDGLAFTVWNTTDLNTNIAGQVYIVSGSFVDGVGSNAVARPSENVHRTWNLGRELRRLADPSKEVRRP